MTTNPTTTAPADATQAPALMRAVIQRGYGPPQRVLSLNSLPRPVVTDTEVLVRVHAAGVNTPDWIAVTGVPRVLRLKLGLRNPATTVRGSDVAGVVEAVGRNVTDLRPGDEVFGSVWDNAPVQRHGTFAQYTAVSAEQLVKKPTTIDFTVAGASVLTGVTALIAMRDVGDVAPGMRVLVNGAAGGVGTMAVQIAKSLGAHVTAVCSTRNVEFVRSLGADEVIDYTKTDFTRSSERYDVLLDNVMNHPPSATARVLAADGILIPNSIGTNDGIFGALPRVASATLLGRRGSTRTGLVTCVVDRDNLTALAQLLETGAVKVVIDRTYTMSNAADAIAHMAGHHSRGKVVIRIDAPHDGGAG